MFNFLLFDFDDHGRYEEGLRLYDVTWKEEGYTWNRPTLGESEKDAGKRFKQLNITNNSFQIKVGNKWFLRMMFDDEGCIFDYSRNWGNDPRPDLRKKYGHTNSEAFQKYVQIVTRKNVREYFGSNDQWAEAYLAYGFFKNNPYYPTRDVWKDPDTLPVEIFEYFFDKEILPSVVVTESIGAQHQGI